MAKEVCKICEREFTSLKLLTAHLRWIHKLFAKEYYDKFLKKEGEGICKREACRNETRFTGLRCGYHDFCCTRCMGLSSDTKLKKKLTCLRHYNEIGRASCREIV